MIEPTPRAGDLEAGLAEIDRRLREIQEELSGGEASAGNADRAGERRIGRSGPLEAALQRAARAEPAPLAPRGTEPYLDAGRSQLEGLQREIEGLSDLRDRLLVSIRELLDGYEAVAHAQPSPGGRHGEIPDPSAEVTLSAGPFATIEEVRAFERAVAEMPGVREASLRGYEGSDRAIVDVRLGRP